MPELTSPSTDEVVAVSGEWVHPVDLVAIGLLTSDEP
jgi:hypothetical protein